MSILKNLLCNSRKVSLIFCLIFVSSQATALNIYRLYEAECRESTGILIGADEDGITMILLDGRIQKFEKKNLLGAALFFSVENPIFGKITPAENNYWGDMLSLRFTQGDKESAVEGWGVDYFEGVFVLYSTEGDLIPVSQDKIRSMRKIPGPSAEQNPGKYRPGRTYISDKLPGCEEKRTPEVKVNGETQTLVPAAKPTPQISASSVNKAGPVIEPTSDIVESTVPDNIIPAYIYLNDNLELWRHIQSKRESVFDKFATFSKRSLFYYRPFLFEADSNFTLGYQKPAQQIGQESLLGMYFSFGSPFGVQSFLGLLGQYQKYGPVQEVMDSFNFGFKAYFLRGLVLGNVTAFGRGSKSIIQNRSFLETSFNEFRNRDQGVVNTFNQIAMSGVDYENYSFLLGTYSPLIAINANNYLREVSSLAPGVILGFEILGKDSELSAFYGNYSVSESDNVNERTMEVIDLRLSNLAPAVIPDVPDEDKAKSFKLTHDMFRLRYSTTLFDFWLTGDALYLRNALDEAFVAGGDDGKFANTTLWLTLQAKLKLNNKIILAGHLGQGYYDGKYERGTVSEPVNYGLLAYGFTFSLIL